jgi:hypothetical protein
MPAAPRRACHLPRRRPLQPLAQHPLRLPISLGQKLPPRLLQPPRQLLDPLLWPCPIFLSSRATWAMCCVVCLGAEFLNEIGP